MSETRRPWTLFAGVLFAGFSLTGCLATRQEIEDLRVDIVHLQNTLAKVQSSQSSYQAALEGNQADLNAQMATLSRNIEILSSHLDESENRMSMLTSRLDDLDKNLTSRLDMLSQNVTEVASDIKTGGKPDPKAKSPAKPKSGPEAPAKAKSSAPPAPSALFKSAYGDFTKRRYDVAAQGFQNYLDMFGDTDKAGEARYYIGECAFAKEDWGKAVESYDEVLLKYPNSSIVPTAYFQKGQALEQLGKDKEALAIYDVIVRKYPYRKEAEAAASRVAALKEDSLPAAKPASR